MDTHPISVSVLIDSGYSLPLNKSLRCITSANSNSPMVTTVVPPTTSTISVSSPQMPTSTYPLSGGNSPQISLLVNGLSLLKNSTLCEMLSILVQRARSPSVLEQRRVHWVNCSQGRGGCTGHYSFISTMNRAGHSCWILS